MSEQKRQRRPETEDDVKYSYTFTVELSDITIEFERIILNEQAKKATLYFQEHRAEELKYVLRVMNEAEERSNMSLMLRILLKNPETVENVLQNTPYKKAIRWVQEYKYHAADAINKPPLLDARKLEMIDYFHQNYKLYKLFPKFAVRLNKNERDIRDMFNMLNRSVIMHINKTPEDYTIDDRESLIQVRETQELTRRIRYLQEMKYRRSVRLRWKNAARSVVLIKTAHELMIEHQQNDMKIDKELEEGKALALIDHRNNMIRLKNKLAELKVVQELYKKDREKTVEMESVLRSQKTKKELQLQAMAKKYDRTMIELFKKIMEVQKKRDQAQRELNEYLQRHYNKVFKVYNQLVLIPEQQANREKQQRIDLYILNRAAKKIQVYWRKWRKALKKKQRLAEKTMGKKKKNF